LSRPSDYNAFAHMPVSNISRIQEWTDHYSGINTLFVYEPEEPDTFTELKLASRIQLQEIIFPDDGTHQVISRIDTNDSSTATSFNVFVPHQAPPSILNPFPSSPTTGSDNNQQISNTGILIGVISGIAAVTIFLLRRK
jgi:hypothetical protein